MAVKIKDVDSCLGCGSCISECPQEGVLELSDDNKITVAKPDDCLECGACVGACPVDVLEV